MAKEVQVTGLDHAMREIRTFDKNLLRRLGNDLRSEVKPDLEKIKSTVEGVEPLLRAVNKIGMFHDGRSSWNGVTVNINRATGSRGTILAITATGRSKKFGFDYAELAGIRRHPPRRISREFTRNGRTMRTRQNGQGDAFIRMLDGVVPPGHTAKPGRFAFQSIVRRMPYIQRKVIKLIEKFADETSYNIRIKD